MDRDQAGELLCRFLGTAGNAAKRQLAAQLTDLQWDELAARSAREHLSPLLYHALCRIAVDIPIPPAIVENLARAYLHTGADNAIFYHFLAEVLASLQAHSIPVIALKGAHLAELIYGNIALRPMCDIDLMVRKEDLPLVARKLLEMGYTAQSYVGSELDCSIHQHLPAFSKKRAPTIEIHWTISSPNHPFAVDVSGLWDRAQAITLAGVEIQGLSPPDLLLHSCIHAAYQHKFEMALISFADIAEILRHYEQEMAWERFLLLAELWKAGKCTYVMLTFAKELFAAKVPEDVLHALEPHDIDKDIKPRFRAKILAGESTAPRLTQRLAQTQRAGGLRGKLAVVMRSIFPSPQRLSRMYPVAPASKRRYWYYLVHLKDLFLWHRGTARHLLLGGGKIAATIEKQNSSDRLIEWLTSV